MTSLPALAEHLTLTRNSATTPFSLYQALLHDHREVDPQTLRRFLQDSLNTANKGECELPVDLANLEQWTTENARHVAAQYGKYLEARRAGAGRRFFSSTSHALYFLQQVAPTKLVDGAWLYGTVRHASDWRYHSLIRTYLEELGDGDPELNHVVLYRKLLADHECAPTEPLDESLYVQGAIQLALGHMSDEFLPEVLGYNLGYEQLPLHLLITAFELNELGIDPYYFTLHVTIDNASTGHAHKAVETVLDLMPGGEAKDEFMRRLRAGYLLNDLGVGSKAIIAGFDLEAEVVAMLERKRSFGQHMHSDYCRLEGLTVNEWLSAPGRARDFLTALENRGWIKRDQDPAQSRFWQLIDGPGAVMFGVFSRYEMQLLHDWIANDWKESTDGSASNPFRARFRRQMTTQDAAKAPEPFSGLSTKDLSFEGLIEHLSPALHPTPEGLHATRAYSRQLAEGSLTR
jgi:hypothetical protein